MNILVVNCGSSSLKCDLLSVDGGAGYGAPLTRLVRGHVDRIGDGAIVNVNGPGITHQESRDVRDHADAARVVLEDFRRRGLFDRGNPRAIGHRVIHGADRFREPVAVDDRVMAEIDSLAELAPLHNRPALQAILAVREAIGVGVPNVAVFDTAFHSTLPEHAWRYAIDHSLADRHRIRRFGFHGLAHRYMTERYCALTSRDPADSKLVTLQLGNGCSAAAIMNGRSVDTSMGFTPLEGLIMGTRSGDLDPSLAVFIAEKERTDARTVEDWLNRRSGLLGISGHSKDMRELLAAEQTGDRRAALAVEMFCYRVKKYIGSYLAALGGVEAVVFGGGIGENSPEVRRRICSGMEWCGMDLDAGRNAEAVGREADISSDGATVRLFVLPVDEASVIAREALKWLQNRESGGLANER